MASPIIVEGDELMRQAHMTAHDFLNQAIIGIDKLLGEGTAKKYPGIVAAYMQTAATDGGATIIAQQIRAGLDDIATVLETSLSKR